MKSTIKRFILISVLTMGLSTSGQSQVMENFCVNSCYDSLSSCNTYARWQWLACWTACAFNWGGETSTYEYDLSHNYYTDACRDNCDWHYEWELAYCDYYFDRCLDNCEGLF